MIDGYGVIARALADAPAKLAHALELERERRATAALRDRKPPIPDVPASTVPPSRTATPSAPRPGSPVALMLKHVAAVGRKRPWLPVNTGGGSPRADDPPERFTKI
jgi:hypothetical protein